MGAEAQGEGILQGSLSLGGCNQGISLLPESTYVWTDPPPPHTHARTHTHRRELSCGGFPPFCSEALLGYEVLPGRNGIRTPHPGPARTLATWVWVLGWLYDAGPGFPVRGTPTAPALSA